MDNLIATLKHLDNAIAALKQFGADIAAADSAAIKELAAQKADTAHKHVVSDITDLTEATTSANGLMSSTDKSKLDGIAAGAQKNTITGIKGNAESTYRTGNVNLTPANIGAAASNHTHVSTGTVSVPTTGWGSDSTTIFPKYYDLSISGILATDRVDLIVAIASLDTALKCGLCGITEASAGKVRIRSRTLPTAAISLQYWGMKK